MREWTRWASRSRISMRSGNGAQEMATQQIDATGVLLDGTSVNGPAELRAALLQQKEQFVQGGHCEVADVQHWP